jgi:hypothetical protein
MSTAAIIAANAAAAARQAEDRVTNHLLGRNAVSPERATLYAPDGAPEARALVSLLDRGAVREAGEGRYWLDRDALNNPLRGQKRLLLVSVIAALLVLMGALLLLLARDRRDDEGRGWTVDPPSPAGVALIHTGRKGVEWEIRCRAAPADLMVVTTDRARGETVELSLDGESFPLQVKLQDGGAGVFAFGAVTPALLQVLQDGAEVRVRNGTRGRRLGTLTAAHAEPFVESCRTLQQGAGAPAPTAP